MGLFRNGSLYVRTAVSPIWATFGNIWATFKLQHLVTLVIDLKLANDHPAHSTALIVYIPNSAAQVARVLIFKIKFILYRGNNVVDNVQDYFLWGCVVTEVELDVLTGEKKVKIWFIFGHHLIREKALFRQQTVTDSNP